MLHGILQLSLSFCTKCCTCGTSRPTYTSCTDHHTVVQITSHPAPTPVALVSEQQAGAHRPARLLHPRCLDAHVHCVQRQASQLVAPRVGPREGSERWVGGVQGVAQLLQDAVARAVCAHLHPARGRMQGMLCDTGCGMRLKRSSCECHQTSRP